MLLDCDNLVHGVQNKVFFEIEPDFVNTDTLYMKVRLVHRLLESLIMEFEEFDAWCRETNPDAPKDRHVRDIEQLVKSCGVRFLISKDENQAAPRFHL
ncbi:hypothetical protein MTO96_035696 [Rhipicephalus appendiculatus]